MQVRVTGGVADLARDQAEIVRKTPAAMVRVVRTNIRAGNRTAKALAKKRSGRHGKHYPEAFSAEMHGLQSALGGGGLVSGEFGPNADLPQGDMSFERGSRKQQAHHELADAADIAGPALARDTSKMVDGLFW